MRLIGETSSWCCNESLVATGDDIFWVGIRGKVTKEMDDKDIAESWRAIYCSNVSMVVGCSLVLVMLVKDTIKEFPLRFSL